MCILIISYSHFILKILFFSFHNFILFPFFELQNSANACCKKKSVLILASKCFDNEPCEKGGNTYQSDAKSNDYRASNCICFLACSVTKSLAQSTQPSHNFTNWVNGSGWTRFGWVWLKLYPPAWSSFDSVWLIPAWPSQTGLLNGIFIHIKYKWKTIDKLYTNRMEAKWKLKFTWYNINIFRRDTFFLICISILVNINFIFVIKIFKRRCIHSPSRLGFLITWPSNWMNLVAHWVRKLQALALVFPNPVIVLERCTF